MKKSVFPIITWVLLGLLILAGTTFSLGKSDVSAMPSASSYSPSGTRAFAELLQAQGYRVDVTTTANPRMSQGDVALAFVIVDRKDILGQPAEPFQNDTKGAIDGHLKGGGAVIAFGLNSNFVDSSKASVDDVEQVANIWNQDAKVNWDEAAIPDRVAVNTSEELANLTTPDKKELTVASIENGVLASLDASGPGRYLKVADGIIATNRFIDKNDNAAEVVRLVRTVAPQGARIVILEASFGNGAPPTILSTLGPWAEAGMWQIVLLFIVIIYTLGRPFGYPDEERSVQRGARDLVDAVAQTYRRARATQIALSSILVDTDHEVRRKLKMPYDVPRAERDRLLPPDLARALANVEVASRDRIPPSEAVGLVQRLNKYLAEFVGEHRLRRKKRKL